MNNKNKTNTPIPYTQTHTSRGQHPHQTRIANNTTNKTANPPSAIATPTRKTDHKKENNHPIPLAEETITATEETPQPAQTSITSIAEPQSPNPPMRRGRMNNQPMMTSLPDYPAHGEGELPNHAQSEGDLENPEP